MNIVLKPAEKKLLKRLIAEGRYESEQEAISDAVRQLDESWIDWTWVKEATAVGIAELDRGEGVVYGRRGLKALGEKIKREGRARLRKQTSRAAR